MRGGEIQQKVRETQEEKNGHGHWSSIPAPALCRASAWLGSCLRNNRVDAAAQCSDPPRLPPLLFLFVSQAWQTRSPACLPVSSMPFQLLVLWLRMLLCLVGQSGQVWPLDDLLRPPLVILALSSSSAVTLLPG